LITLFVLVAFSQFLLLNPVTQQMPLSQAEGGCSDGKMTSMYSLYITWM